MTKKQQIFCEEYLKDLNATRAYKVAYPKIKKDGTARTNASRLLTNANVQKYINSELDKMQSERTADVREILEYLTAVMRGNNQSEELILRSVGKGGQRIERVMKKPSEKDRLKAAELLARRYNLLSGEYKSDHTGSGTQYSGIPAALIAPAFSSALFDISDHGHTEYVFPGGRGSAKSTFVGLNIPDLLMRNDELHALVLRQYSNTLKDSVYAQIIWGINALGLDDEFDYTKSPLEITRKKTGQKIFFRGADDPNKIKSIKPEFGYIGTLWFEELDQFHGEEEVRRIEQSAIRGGDTAFVFKTFNPPKSALNWANKYIKIPDKRRLVTMSDYLTVPRKWLGEPFIEQAEFLRETNPAAYENEYLGIANGSGGNVFENVEIREITDDEISRFDNIMNGVDWGYYPDKFAFVRVHYAAAQHTLYIFDEYTSNKQSNRETADALIARGITASDLITCDSAEPKSVGDYRAFGLSARPAEKGPDSRKYSYKWLQGLRMIVIDNIRCPVACEEFLGKEYERDRDGNIISGYPDGADHTIDAVRYATERKWRRRGA